MKKTINKISYRVREPGVLVVGVNELRMVAGGPLPLRALVGVMENSPGDDEETSENVDCLLCIRSIFRSSTAEFFKARDSINSL